MPARVPILTVTLTLALGGPAEASFWKDLEESLGLARKQAEQADKEKATAAEPPEDATAPAAAKGANGTAKGAGNSDGKGGPGDRRGRGGAEGKRGKGGN